jgi:aryl-alcohol dehydrogenase-like predicted oxidoreductase
MLPMQFNRRQFLTTTLAGAGAMLIGGPQLSAAPDTANPYAVVPLGKTGLKVSRIGFGTGMRAGMRESSQTRLGRDSFERMLRAAFDRGVRLFDMADMYGTHAYVAGAFKGIPRDQYVLVTKIWMHSGGIPEADRPDANVVVDRFRKELGTDYIDLVLLHCLTAPNWPQQSRKQMDFLADLKSRLVVRAHGVSVHSLPALKACVDTPWVDSVHARINAFGVAMDAEPEAVSPLLKQIHDAGKGVVGMKLIGEGRFSSDEQRRNESIRYVLGLGSVDTMVVGFESLNEVDDFAARVKAALGARPT